MIFFTFIFSSMSIHSDQCLNGLKQMPKSSHVCNDVAFGFAKSQNYVICGES